MERYFYFGEDTVSTTGSSCLFPLSSFLGMTPAGAAITMMHFKARNKKNPFLIVHDGESGSSIGNLPNNKKITSVAVTTVA